MTYTVLARKWRPRRFEELVGQPHVVRALVNSLAENRLHHAYLFSGTRGVGKTTIARVLAKALNCETGIVAEPCGACATCVAIDEGRFVDLIEVDAASRTKIDETRELLDNVQYAPTRGRFKVYLIDEVHQLSAHSFNALLKTLEEPPPHVKFLLATTDPQKLPITVLSRCLQFNLKKLTVAQIQGQLERICAAEGIAAEPEGLKAIARAAEGSLRDSLSLLDQAIAFGDGKIEAAAVAAMLGTIDRRHVLRMLDALAAADGAALLGEVDRLDELAADYAAVLDGLLAALQHVAVEQLVPGRLAEEELEGLGPLAARLSPEDVQLYYQIAVQGRRDLAVARDPRVGFEMTLLRMLAFRPVAADEPPGERPRAGGKTTRGAAEASSAGPAADAGPSAEPPRAVRSVPETAPAGAAPSANEGAARPSGLAIAALSPAPAASAGATPLARPISNAGAPPGAQPAPVQAATSTGELAAPAAASTGAPPLTTPVQAIELRGPDSAGQDAPSSGVDWHALLRSLDLRGPARQLADNCALGSAAGGTWQLVLAGDKSHLNTPQVRARLEAALSEQQRRPIRLAVSPGRPSAPTPADARKASENERIRAAREAIENDPNVKAVQAAFDAVVEPDSIRSTQ